MRRQRINEDVKFNIVFSKGKGAVTAKPIDNEKSPNSLFWWMKGRRLVKKKYEAAADPEDARYSQTTLQSSSLCVMQRQISPKNNS